MSGKHLNDISKVYLDTIANVKKAETDADIKRWEDLGGPTPGNYRADDNSAKLKEGRRLRKSDWREDLREVIDRPETEEKAEKKVDEKKGIKNKIVINPTFKEAIQEIGGELLEVNEVDSVQKTQDDTKKKQEQHKKQLEQKQKKVAAMKKLVLRKKMQAVSVGGGEDITAGYEPEGDQLDERLGGKGYKPYTSLTGKKVSGDWEDSDRGAGNKAKKRAGGKVEKKSPTYQAYVLNKEEVVLETKDKKGKGSGTKDACYHKVKSRYSVWPSAYASGALVKCRKVGAANWGNSSKKEEFEYQTWKTDAILEKVAAWQRKEGKRESGGLNQKGVDSYRRENPGSKLKTAVTTKPSKLKKGSKAANRRKSFCARMGGMKKRLTSAKTARDPDSRINKALRKWNCSYEPQGTPIMEQDRALDFVRKSIEKKHGKGAIYDPKKDRPPSEAQKKKVAVERKKRQDADNKAYAARAKKAGFKSTQDYTNVVARYGSEDNYRKGKGLGT